MSNQKPIADNLFTWPSDQPKLLGSIFFQQKNQIRTSK